MNKIILIGNLVRDAELKYAPSGTGYAKYTLVVKRDMAKEGAQQTDFIDCVSFGKQAEYVASYIKKGNTIAVVGRLNIDQYKNKEGKNAYKTVVMVENIQNLTRKKDEMQPLTKEEEDIFKPIEDGEELPF